MSLMGWSSPAMAADTWEPLFAVAELAGQPWPARAHAAVLALKAETADGATDQASDRVRLLADVHTAFADLTVIPTTLLLQRLRGDPEAPWREYGPTGLTARRLGALLAEYGICSRNIRFTEGQAKGYQRNDFTDSWNRYTPHLLAPDPESASSVPSVPPPFQQARSGRQTGLPYTGCVMTRPTPDRRDIAVQLSALVADVVAVLTVPASVASAPSVSRVRTLCSACREVIPVPSRRAAAGLALAFPGPRVLH